MRRHKNVINVAEAESAERLTGSRFGGAVKKLGVLAGGEKIGCNYFEIPPGRALCPHHWHASNEEAIFVIEGEGTMRIGSEEVPVRSGDYVAFPTGPETAHQLVNSGEAPLRYLCLSTKNPVEVVGYPDSKKIGALAGAAGSADKWVGKFFPDDADVDYFVGEDS